MRKRDEMKTRRENHKYLVFEQQMEKRNTRLARKYGYIENPRHRQIKLAYHRYIVSFKRNHQMAYAYQTMVNGLRNVGKKIGKDMINNMRENGFKL